VIETGFPLKEQVSESTVYSVLPAGIVTSIGVERRLGEVATVLGDKVTFFVAVCPFPRVPTTIN
jgi:hypothetical protein